MGRTLLDRDTAPGAEPEDLMRIDIPALVIPGRDPSHATSAANSGHHYLVTGISSPSSRHII